LFLGALDALILCIRVVGFILAGFTFNDPVVSNF
jgi:hypothetical protein